MRPPRLGRSLPLAWLLAIAIGSAEGPAQAQTSVGLSALPAYQTALARPNPQPGKPPARTTTFRELWDHPEAFQGKRVRVEGRVERVFHQPAVGQFPALAEAWVVDASGDPFCLVFPEGSVTIGSVVRFSGDFLRLIRYKGADLDRLAPLIVGPEPPTGLNPPASPGPPQAAADRRFGTDLVFWLIVASIAMYGIARAVAKRPPTLRRPDVDPAPVFDDGGAE